ncbi:MAG: hypothetical protein FP825_06670 [Hyphomonas sp.]|uniref:hypothetical protein n=1 Tax=Hyphomonas sp. TaxID=87 RepID=UPI0017BC1D8E|nr:hypothetical protein [Hyphomonas sp.]MBU3921703.1 hypothetical protein [Alphaproteobacteria bacterium]MBA3068143.1 hypothetical protein [Hyphomonas sp.]MBU4061122.1 hypothetical protein [Alphaproteobacteria bacterium]MBU4162846.1 hypothetical protein [Alphaproteobacteria bacterium]MBU4568164.1 hypothetical protein [Alphaproteobacteria bacterium]
MRQARPVDVEPVRTVPTGTPTDGMSGPCAPHPPLTAVSSPAVKAGPLGDWIDSQAQVLGLWLDRLIEQGDPGDLISMVHRQQVWLELMRGRIQKG